LKDWREQQDPDPETSVIALVPVNVPSVAGATGSSAQFTAFMVTVPAVNDDWSSRNEVEVEVASSNRPAIVAVEFVITTGSTMFDDAPEPARETIEMLSATIVLSSIWNAAAWPALVAVPAIEPVPPKAVDVKIRSEATRLPR
jgi:hypothetical protein